MANICNNTFFLSNEGNDENYLRIRHKLIEAIDTDRGEFYGDITYEDEDFVEGWFESKWVFPVAIMEEMIPEETEGVYFRCLSEELGCTYIAMNVFKDGSWWDEQTFDF